MKFLLKQDSSSVYKFSFREAFQLAGPVFTIVLFVVFVLYVVSIFGFLQAGLTNMFGG